MRAAARLLSNLHSCICKINPHPLRVLNSVLRLLGAVLPTKVANRQNLVHRLLTSHVSRQNVSHWENGKTIPDIQSLILLCELYGITLKDLLSDDVDVIRANALMKRNKKRCIDIGITIIATYLSLIVGRWISFTLSMMLVTFFSTIGVILTVNLTMETKRLGLNTYKQLAKYLNTGSIPSMRRTKVSKFRIIILLSIGIFIGLLFSLSIGKFILGWNI